MKSTKGSRRRRNDAIERELRSLRDEVQLSAGGRLGAGRESEGSKFVPRLETRQRRAASRPESSDSRRNSEDIGSQLSNERLQGRPLGDAFAAATDDSYDDEESKAPFSGTPAATSFSARLAQAEKALAEVTVQRDEALESLRASRSESTKLRAELEHARSYKALYATAHQEHKGMKASLAASTQICMGQQQLIQMLQASSRPSALDPEELLAGPGSGGGGSGAGGSGAGLPLSPQPSPSPPLAQGSARGGAKPAEEEVDKSSALAAAAIALARGRSEVGVGRELGGEEEEAANLRLRARKSVGGGGGGDDDDDDDAGEKVRQPYVRSPALFPESDVGMDDAADSARRAASARREVMAKREGLVAASAAVDDGNERGKGGGAAGSVAGRVHLLDDDLISHSSLRREYDETFLNQPLRGEQRRGEPPSQGHHHHHRWSYGGGDGGGTLEGGSGSVGVDAGNVLAGHGRARGTRAHARDKLRGKSGSQSSVSTVASTTKSTKALGAKEDRRARKGKSDHGSAAARDTNATGSGRGTRGGSPRPSAPRQARAAQRLSSRISANSVSASAAAAAAAGGSAGEPREAITRRGSAGSSTVRLSSRKR